MTDKKATTWQDSPSTATPITAAQLNRMESKVRERRYQCPAGQTSIDEFDDSTKDPAWVEVYPAARPTAAVWTEDADVMSAYFAGGGNSNDLHCIMRPLSGAGGALADGDAFITAFRVFAEGGNTYAMGGIVLADGVTFGSGTQMTGLTFHGGVNSVLGAYNLRSWSGYNSNTDTLAGNIGMIGPVWYSRVVKLPSNQWRHDASPDGVSWILGTAWAKTMPTFTHVGLLISSFGGATRGVVSYEFIRRVSGVS